MINVIISFGAIIGIGKLSRELFNKQVGRIVFLISYFYPVFFGHMLFNNKDTILALKFEYWLTQHVAAHTAIPPIAKLESNLPIDYLGGEYFFYSVIF